jgi:hypothetical protein
MLTERPLSPRADIARIVAWYLREDLPQASGASRLPFYCDPKRVGAFAVSPKDLAAGDDAAVFRVFVTLSMYQALRDVVIMRQQLALPPGKARVVADLSFVKRSVARHDCPTLASPEAFEEGCDVFKCGTLIDCGRRRGARCHVKDATAVFNRMGDMGKLPTSAWLRLWKKGGARASLAEVCRQEASPSRRAELLVARFAQVHRVGRKLATMFVSALSTPALAPGLTPWFPDIDGNELVVVDTNVARSVDTLRRPGCPKTYDERERWVRKVSAQVDLRGLRRDFPRYSPRVVQQALYAFASRSNRTALGDPCINPPASCARCVPRLCPFTSARSRLRLVERRTTPSASRGPTQVGRSTA